MIMSIQECFQVAKHFFLKDGNLPYCEDWNHIDTVAIHDQPQATENSPTCHLGIDFPGRPKILFAGNYAISKIGTAKNKAPILNAKG